MPKPWSAEAYQADIESARGDPQRLALYLRWWLLRPSRWLENIDDDGSEEELPDLPEAEGQFFVADNGAHMAAVDLGLLVDDPRPGVGAWQLSATGRAFAQMHMPRPAPAQLDLFGAMECSTT